VTLADIAREATLILNRLPKPIRVPDLAWSALRRIAWSRLVRANVPPRARVSYWRLTLVIDDGFWYDARKFLTQNTRPLVLLQEGLRRTIEADSQKGSARHARTAPRASAPEVPEYRGDLLA
jgi:hypothetical protein